MGATLVIEGMLGNTGTVAHAGKPQWKKPAGPNAYAWTRRWSVWAGPSGGSGLHRRKHDSLALMVCIARWLPLLSSDNDHVDRSADESGEVFRLERAGARWRHRSPADAEDGGQSIVSEWSIGERPARCIHRGSPVRWQTPFQRLVRAGIGGQELRARGSMVNAGDSACLAVALLVRAPTKNALPHPQFELYATDLVRSAARLVPTVHLGSDGRPLYVSGTDAARARMLAGWSLDKKTTPFVLEQGRHATDRPGGAPCGERKPVLHRGARSIG